MCSSRGRGPAKRENKANFRSRRQRAARIVCSTPRRGIGKALRAPPADVLRNTRLNSEMANFCFSSDDRLKGRAVTSRVAKRHERDKSSTHRSSSALLHRHHVRTATAVSNRQPSLGRGSGLLVVSPRRLTTRYTFVVYTQQRHTRAHTFSRHYIERSPSARVKGDRERFRRRRREDARPRKRACQSQDSREPHGMATASATQRVRRFKRYVTVSAGAIIGRRGSRRPIGRALVKSRGKAKVFGYRRAPKLNRE